jgi:hypothetical protein
MPADLTALSDEELVRLSLEIAGGEQQPAAVRDADPEAGLDVDAALASLLAAEDALAHAAPVTPALHVRPEVTPGSVDSLLASAERLRTSRARYDSAYDSEQSSCSESDGDPHDWEP